MRFCPRCDNMLIPKNRTLYCKVCEKYFNFDLKIDDYTIVKIIKHDDKESASISIKNGIKIDKILLKAGKTSEDFLPI